jgi:hypothetical protein
MMNLTLEEELARIPPSERILLLPHCLRPSQTCPGKYSKQGLVCPDDCCQPCAIRTLREAAIKLNYKGWCVAPGGAMALRYVKQMHAKAVVAVACEKELEMGIHGVQSAADNEETEMPVIVVIPLSKDGCVDTEVDMDQALKTVELTEEMPSFLQPACALCVPA